MRSLLVDDVRMPYSLSTDIVRTAEVALVLLDSRMTSISYDVLMLDHDLGYGKSGLEVARLLEELSNSNYHIPSIVEVVFMNPVGVEAISATLKNIYPHTDLSGRIFYKTDEDFARYGESDLGVRAD